MLLAPAIEQRLKKRGLGGGSEEHTSELQSQSNLVCRLLLENKKRQPAVPRHPYSRFPGDLQPTSASPRAQSTSSDPCSDLVPAPLRALREPRPCGSSPAATC